MDSQSQKEMHSQIDEPGNKEERKGEENTQEVSLTPEQLALIQLSQSWASGPIVF